MNGSERENKRKGANTNDKERKEKQDWVYNIHGDGQNIILLLLKITMIIK